MAISFQSVHHCVRSSRKLLALQQHSTFKGGSSEEPDAWLGYRKSKYTHCATLFLEERLKPGQADPVLIVHPKSKLGIAREPRRDIGNVAPGASGRHSFYLEQSRAPWACWSRFSRGWRVVAIWSLPFPKTVKDLISCYTSTVVSCPRPPVINRPLWPSVEDQNLLPDCIVLRGCPDIWDHQTTADGNYTAGIPSA